MKSIFQRSSLVICALAAPTATLHAQALVGFDGVTGDVITFTGTPGSCGYPGGPLRAQVTLVDSLACFVPALPGHPDTTSQGAVIVQESGDITITGQSIAARYAPSGLSTSAFDLSGWGYGPLTGATIQRGAGPGGSNAIWYTDGTHVGLFSSDLSCGGLPERISSVAFADYAGPGILTGLALYHRIGPETMWACTSDGRVVNFDLSGNELDSFTQSLPSLSGIAVDAATSALFITDGTTVACHAPTGSLANDFWWPMSSEASLGALVGLDWIPATLSYGSGGVTGGGTPPTLEAEGWAYAGNPAYAFKASGDPGAVFLLFWSAPGPPICPTLQVFGLDLLVRVPFFEIGALVAGPSGEATFPIPIPDDHNIVGAHVHTQAAALLAGGEFASTQGLVFAIAGSY